MIRRKCLSFDRVLLFIILICLIALSGYRQAFALSSGENFRYEYGVFLGVDAGKKAMRRFRNYKTIVLDVQSDFTKEDIDKLKANGHTVYSYINVGAVENYRDYYNKYLDITLEEYENWPDERWVDVSSKRWQDFILKDLSVRIINTGVDGFFVDNVDVYYQYHTKEIYDGTEVILKGLKENGKVIINGGDTFVMEYLSNGGNPGEILDGINQESVFSCILDYNRNRFGENDADSREYYLNYTETIRKNNKDVYLLEYTRKRKLKNKIREFCDSHGYHYYVSRKLDLK